MEGHYDRSTLAHVTGCHTTGPKARGVALRAPRAVAGLVRHALILTDRLFGSPALQVGTRTIPRPRWTLHMVVSTLGNARKQLGDICDVIFSALT